MLVTRKKYKELCNAKNIGTINNRINKGYIKLTIKALPDGSEGEYIDTKKFPPTMIREAGGGRKKAASKLKVKNGKLKTKPKKV